VSCLILVVIIASGCKKAVVYPELEDMVEFGRSIFHTGEAILSSNFEESVIKSAMIVKGKLVAYEETDEAYVIYEFEILESIKNPYDDVIIQVYEPKLASGELLYDIDGIYVLVLSRTTDLYYQTPVAHNFNNLKIELDTSDNLIVAEATSGEVDLIKVHNLKTYEDLKTYIELVRSSNTTIKDGSFSFEGRDIKSEDINDIVEGSTYMQLITLKEVLYENRLLKEWLVDVENSYKGEVEDTIIVSIPTYLDVQIGETYLAGMFRDGNYNLSGSHSLIREDDTNLMEAYLKILEKDVIEEEEEEEEVIVKEREWIINPLYQSFYDINEDFVGWFSIEDTAIDYPVLLGPDNVYYLKHDIYDEASTDASIIMDYRMNIKSIQNQTLVYGHNMIVGTMFHEITYYKNKDFFDAHPIIVFNTLYDEMNWEVFSVHVIDSNYTQILEYPLSDPVEYQAYLDDIIERSMFITDVEVTTNDKILTLVTCSYEFDGARTILHAKLIQ